MQDKIPLFYWSEIKFIFKQKENYGDLLSKYLVEKISGKEMKWIHPKKQPWYKWDKTNYVTIGSILHHASKNSIVWGSGIIDKEQHITKADYRAVRGPRTRKFLLKLGYECPEVYGDPALLLPKYYHPEAEKKYKLGIIPHYHDFKFVLDLYKNDTEILVIDLMTLDVEEVTKEILSCERTISSSLHGVIVSHAYGIPSIWVEFSDKIFGDGIKYRDYLESVEIPFYQAEFIRDKYSLERLQELLDKHENLPKGSKIKEIQKGLIESCPFRNSDDVTL
ncbi:polysaccharide pyruvyl transferase family protein [Gillisia hiemivivida]|uniref:Polysaccharide pyruvyl transferase family protein n=1 Tax=Gillisia hiemivivida TaxID=291190 RepID=A0A5C6ZSQ4_9FLAO|nr:polysaccharide pyruvyl transferase family protein [Gillisia hiemivivida]TXD93877.1 polysaccharide pyruvyl transferase family protein [Gillisia hiemivivida]